MGLGFTVQVYRHPPGRVTARAFLGRIMRPNKANFAGLTSTDQQSEMKSILAGAWPPLKPLPVFKYETAEYRATIHFDRKRGEWVCRKTSLPSNEVQELRGGLREITMALPHGEAATFTEEAEQQEQELEKDAHRRLQAMREWREKYENGARYFELRDFLSERQRIELDDSLRLSLTARQLQFNPKNVANVFDDLSVAGGRFAALFELANRNKANGETSPHARGDGTLPEAGRAPDNDKPSLGISSTEFAGVMDSPAEVDFQDTADRNGLALNDNAPVVPNREAAEQSTDTDDFPAVSIKNVFPEQDQPSIAERMAHKAPQQFEIDTSETVDSSLELNPPSLVEHPHEEEHRSPALAGLAPQVCTAKSSAERFEASSWRFPRLGISAFQVNAIALLFLFAATAFTVGLTVGRGALGRRLREPPQLLLAREVKPATLPDQPDEADESSSRTPTPTPAVASSNDSAGINTPDEAAPSEEKSKENRGISDLAEVHTTDADSSLTTESEPSVKPEVSSERSGTIGPVVRRVQPRASSRLVRRRKAARSIRSAPRSLASYRLSSTIGATPHVPKSSAILVTVPDRGSQPFRVSFPNKTIAATSSLAMTSQLSVLVSAEPGATVVRESARLEAGGLVSFVWPRYSEPRGRYGLAQTIRVRATIGQLGQVEEVKFLGGSTSLLPATMEAIRQWRYTPTLLDKRPVQAQQDVTIEFRPPRLTGQVGFGN